MFENVLLVRQRHAETLDSKFRNRLEKITELMNEEWQIDSINSARHKCRVMQQRRERMSNRITDHAVNARPSRERMRAIEMLHFVKGDLTGRGCFSDRGVRQSASCPQPQDSSGQPHLPHRNCNEILRAPGQPKQANAVGNRAGVCGDLCGVHQAMSRHPDLSRQFCRPIEIVDGKQDAFGYGVLAYKSFRQLSIGFHFQIAPLAACLARLHQPVQLLLSVPGELPSAFATPAGSDKSCLLRIVLRQPTEESRAFRVVSQPIKTQFDGLRFSQGRPDLSTHSASRGGCHHRANAPYPCSKQAHTLPSAANFIENTAPSMPYQKCKATLANLLTREVGPDTFARITSLYGPKGVFSKELWNAR